MAVDSKGTAQLADRLAIGYWGAFLVFCGLYLWVHDLAGFTFPIPWQDEGSFLWEAIALQRHNDLVAPQLNPERALMWEFPGLMVLHGLLFKLTGFSLEWARLLSALYILGGMGFLAASLRRYRWSWPSLILVGAFLLNRHFVFMGNMFRFEALVLLMVGASLYLISRHRIYPALVLLSLSALVHPAGWYFSLGGGVYCLLRLRAQPEERRVGAGDLALIALALASWLAYGSYVALNWPAFVHDMSFQFQFKDRLLTLTGGFWAGRFDLVSAVTLLLAAGCVAYGAIRRSPIIVLASVAIPAKLMIITAPGALYRIYDSLFHLLLSIMLLHLVLDAPRISDRLRYRGLIALVVLVSLLGANHLLGHVESPLGYPSRLQVLEMGFAKQGVRYINDVDRAAVREFLASRASITRPLRVQFYPQADALFFADIENEDLRFLQPTFYDNARPDLHIVHVSRYSTRLVDRIRRLQLRHYGLPAAPGAGWSVLHERDQTETWLFSSSPAR